MFIKTAIRSILYNPNIKKTIQNNRNMSDHNNFPYKVSIFQWLKFKDLTNYYLIIGVVPCTIIVIFADVFVGPAKLKEIPENYEPKYWEYYSNPITRFLARYFLGNPQQEYEKFLHHLYEEDEKRKIRAVEDKILLLMSERNDYQAYYYRPVMAKYHRLTKETSDYVRSLSGGTRAK